MTKGQGGCVDYLGQHLGGVSQWLNCLSRSQREGFGIDLCLCLTSFIWYETRSVASVLWICCLPQRKQSQRPAEFLPLPSAPAAGLAVDWRMARTLQIEAKHVITQTLSSATTAHQLLRLFSRHRPIQYNILLLLYFCPFSDQQLRRSF